MIKVYLDWNVMSQMKNNNHKELYEILLNNDKFFKPYSTSHVGDLLASYSDDKERQILIQEDLHFISKLTRDFCIYNDGEKISFDFTNPEELFEQRVAELELFKNFGLDTIIKTLDENDATKGFSTSLLNLLKFTPIDKPFIEALENPNSAAFMNEFFPGLKDNPTMSGFFESFGKMLQNMNEGDGYSYLRQTIQKGLGINRDKVFHEKSPYSLIEKAYSKFGLNYNQHATDSKYAPEWFNAISNEYIMLDMHGYQEDKVSINKGRKETFKNTTEDSFHAAFASTCHFYIINDKKSFNKTKQVYQKLKINTVVCKPEEFVEHYYFFLNFDSFSTNIQLILKIFETGPDFEKVIDGKGYRTFYFPFFLFNFFNKIITVYNNEEQNSKIILLQDGPSNNKGHYQVEIENLVSNITRLVGTDVNCLGEIKGNELFEEKWIGRKWKFEKFLLDLKIEDNLLQMELSVLDTSN